MAQDTEFRFKYELEVKFPRNEWANVVRNSLAVDKELHPDQVKKSLTVEGETLKCVFVAVDPKILRTAVSSFYDFLILVTKTVDQFGVVDNT